jgi:hypothetical protein
MVLWKVSVGRVGGRGGEREREGKQEKEVTMAGGGGGV